MGQYTQQQESDFATSVNVFTVVARGKLKSLAATNFPLNMSFIQWDQLVRTQGLWNRVIATVCLQFVSTELKQSPCGISTGIYGYPLYSASRIALRVVREWLQNDENRKNIKRIVFCTFLENEEKCYYELMPIYFPVTHPTQTLTPTEVSPISLLDTQQEKQNQSPAQYSSKSKANKRKRSEAKWKKQKTMEQKPIQSLKEKPTEQKKEDVSQSTAVGVSSTTSQNKNRNKESEFDTHPQERNETNTPQSQQLDNSVPSATKDQNPTEILSENQNREQSHLPLSQTHSQQSQSQSQGSNLSTVSSTTNAEVSQPVPTETSSSFTQSQTTATATATTTTTQNESKMDKTESVSSPSKESI